MTTLSIPRDSLVPVERTAQADDACLLAPLDEDGFRAFYDRNARTVWAYIARVSGDRQLADDLLQETFFRFLRAGAVHASDSHRRRSLFQIATNLVRDSGRRRRLRGNQVPFDETTMDAPQPSEGSVADRTDLRRAMGHLKSSERELLWLAYAQGLSHHEIAEILGLKSASIRLLLFRARGKLARLMRGVGLGKSVKAVRR